MKRTAIYIRVSTQEQAQEGYSIPAQKERLIAYCKARDWIISGMYIDPGYSGSNLDRPGMQQLIAETNKFDIVLVYKLDRLSRSQRDTLYLIEEVFLPREIDFISMHESFDTSTPFGRAMIGILSVFAQLEREQIRERAIMGKRERAKAGFFHGGPYLPIGYDRKDGKLVINEYEALQIKYIFDLYLSGLGGKAIINKLNEKGYSHKNGPWRSASRALSVLDNPVYTGTLRTSDIVYENAHEAIIDKETFSSVQKLRQRRKSLNLKAYQPTSLLQGFLFCEKCGARYHLRVGRNGYRRYFCYSRDKSNKERIKDPNCKNKIWKVDELESIIEANITNLSLNKSYFKSIISKEPPSRENNKLKALNKQLEEIQGKINKLMLLYQNDIIPLEDINSRIGSLYENKKMLKNQIEIVSNKDLRNNEFDYSQIKELLKTIPHIWSLIDIEGKRNILHTLIDKIELNDYNVRIYWSFVKK